MMAILILLATLFLAYANGANDNFKGVATLFGSRSCGYRRAIGWATVTTLAGSLCSLLLAGSLAKAFTGKGLVPDAVVAMSSFTGAVALAAAATVMLATVLGFPVSTTHGLVGALVGAGLVAAGSAVHLVALGKVFLAPLLFSPVAACGLAAVGYVAARIALRRRGVGEMECVVIGDEPLSPPGAERPCDCEPLRRGRKEMLLDAAPFLSAGAVSFARGLNDTPKIVSLLLGQALFAPQWSLVLVAAAMAVGGLLNARRVAETMSERITPMSPGQGFAANLVASVLITGASRFGLPVSTTHVTCGGLFGIGLVTGKGDSRTIEKVVASWVLTLQVAAVLAAVFYAIGL
ncbi:MAG: inorganic phosphate transporter [Armatimonadetes bacterium]|nr:inorganic phosphate transporter [Armatimonadota bacterium]